MKKFSEYILESKIKIKELEEEKDKLKLKLEKTEGDERQKILSYINSLDDKLRILVNNN